MQLISRIIKLIEKNNEQKRTNDIRTITLDS